MKFRRPKFKLWMFCLVIVAIGIALRLAAVALQLSPSHSFHREFCSACAMERREEIETVRGYQVSQRFAYSESNYTRLYQKYINSLCNHTWVDEHRQSAPLVTTNCFAIEVLDRVGSPERVAETLKYLNTESKGTALRRFAVTQSALADLHLVKTPAQADAWWSKNSVLFAAKTMADPLPAHWSEDGEIHGAFP